MRHARNQACASALTTGIQEVQHNVHPFSPLVWIFFNTNQFVKEMQQKQIDEFLNKGTNEQDQTEKFESITDIRIRIWSESQ